MLIRDVMTRHVIALRPKDSLREAIAVFAKNRISGAPVVDSRGRLVGIVTEMDILRRLEIGTMEFCHAAPPTGRATGAGAIGPGLRFKSLLESLDGAGGLTVAKLMTSSVVTARPDDPVQEKAALMVHRRIRRLPVVDGRGRLVGILSRKDLVRMLNAARPARRTKAGPPGIGRGRTGKKGGIRNE